MALTFAGEFPHMVVCMTTTLTRAPRLERWLTRTLGEHRVVSVVADNEHGTVLEVVDDDGRWFAKRVVLERHWQSEVRAHRRWSPALRGLMPTLRAVNPRLQGLVVDALPGEHPDPFDAAAHRAAGQTLVRLQAVRPPRPARPGVLTRPLRRVESVLGRDPDLFTAAEAGFARSRTAVLRDLPPMPLVPSHGDYKPHNWLLDDAGTLRVIDFAESRWDVPAADLCRLSLGPWWDQPHLADAFLAGYGRRLEEHEAAYVSAHVVTNAVVSVWFNQRHGRTEERDAARDRLHALMDGHEVELTESGRRRAVRGIRSVARRIVRPG